MSIHDKGDNRVKNDKAQEIREREPEVRIISGKNKRDNSINLIADIYGQIFNTGSYQSMISNKLVNESTEDNIFKVYDPFDSPDIDDYSDTDMNRNKLRLYRNQHSILCTDCDVEMIRSSVDEMSYECEKCGRIIEDVGTDIDMISSQEGGGSSDVINSYNTSETSAIPIRVSGPNCYMYQKNLMSNTSNYRKTQKKTTNTRMLNYILQHDGSVPSKSIAMEAAELYYEIQQHCIKRGDVLKGCMGACLYRLCDYYGITRKPKEIADIFGIPQSELSNGEKILDDLESQGLIKIKKHNIKPEDEENRSMHAFLNRYFESLNIPIDKDDEEVFGRPNYKDFASKLIRFTRKYRIAESSIMSSKCSGAVYILSVKRKELQIKRDIIEKECKISKSTFGRFSQAVFAMLNSEEEKDRRVRSRLRNLFKKYQIPI